MTHYRNTRRNNERTN